MCEMYVKIRTHLGEHVLHPAACADVDPVLVCDLHARVATEPETKIIIEAGSSKDSQRLC